MSQEPPDLTELFPSKDRTEWEQAQWYRAPDTSYLAARIGHALPVVILSGMVVGGLVWMVESSAHWAQMEKNYRRWEDAKEGEERYQPGRCFSSSGRCARERQFYRERAKTYWDEICKLDKYGSFVEDLRKHDKPYSSCKRR